MVMPEQNTADEISKLRAEQHKAFLQKKEKAILPTLENIVKTLEKLQSITFLLFDDDQQFNAELNQGGIIQPLCDVIQTLRINKKEYLELIEKLKIEFRGTLYTLPSEMRDFGIFIENKSALVDTFINNISENYSILFVKYSEICIELGILKRSCEFIKTYIKEAFFPKIINPVEENIPELTCSESPTQVTQSSTNDSGLFSVIPNEILHRIISHLPSEYLWILAGTNQRFRKIICDIGFLQKRFQSHFPYRLAALAAETGEKNWLIELTEAAQAANKVLRSDKYEELPDKIKDLFFAAKNGDLYHFLHVELYDLMQENRYGHTPLMWLNRNGHRHILDMLFKLILQLHVKIKEENRSHNITKPIMIADMPLLLWAITCQQSLENVIAYDKNPYQRWGIECELSLEVISRLQQIEDEIALTYAIKFNRSEIINYFLQKNLVPQEVDFRLAAQNGNLDLLLQIKDHTQKISSYASAAASGGHLNVVNRLLSLEAVDIYLKEYLWDCVHAAARAGQTHVLQAILAHPKFDWSPKFNERSHRVQSPLYSAVEGGHIGTVKFLLGLQHDVNAGDINDTTPLNVALQYGHFEILELLLSHGATNIPTERKQTQQYFITPLHIAINLNQICALKILIKDIKDINVKDQRDSTPLHSAAANGRVEMVEILTLNGADVNIQNAEGLTPLSLAVKNGHVAVVKKLLEHPNINLNLLCSKKLSALHYAHDTEITSSLLTHPEILIDQNESGYTPLQLAAFRGFTEIVALLIQRGANVNSCSVITKKRTPLHLAIISEAPIEKRINIIRQLVAAKADAQLKDEYGYSSLEAILNHADNYWSHLSAELSAMLKPNMELEPLSFAQCIHDKNLIMMKKILDCSNDFPLKSKGAYGRSLFYAVHYSTPEIVCELLSRSPKLPGLKSSSKLFLSIIENSEFSPLKKAILVYLINRKLSKREYETSLTFCGYTLFTSFRFSRTEKLSAAEALRAVIFNHEEESVLQGHVGALNSGRLSMVYRMYLKEKAEQQKALEMRM